MQFQEKQIANILALNPSVKRIDASVALKFKEFILERINMGNVKIILDLTGVDFIDSSGLGAIVACLKVLKGKGYLVICGLSETVSTLFSLTRMDKAFRIFTTEEDALKIFQSDL